MEPEIPVAPMMAKSLEPGRLVPIGTLSKVPLASPKAAEPNAGAWPAPP